MLESDNLSGYACELSGVGCVRKWGGMRTVGGGIFGNTLRCFNAKTIKLSKLHASSCTRLASLARAARRQSLRRTQRAHVRVVCHVHDITNTERRRPSTRREASALANFSAASFVREAHSRGKATIAAARIRAKVWQRDARVTAHSLPSANVQTCAPRWRL